VTDRLWQGQLDLGDRWAIWRGSIGHSVPHRHLAAQLVLADTPVSVHDGLGQLHTARAVLIDPLVLHRLEPHDQAQQLYLEAVAPSAEAIAKLANLRPLPELAILSSPNPRLQAWRRVLADPDAPRPAPLPDSLRRSLAVVDAHLAEGPVPLAAAARAADLSSERYRHLFVEAMGLPFRRYLLWRRVRQAVVALKAGDDVTTAAHAAGFADAAHFARTLKAMFGVTATQIPL
jgi:AraC-like DNA-binding protein